MWNGEKSVLWNLMEQAYHEERAQMMRRMMAKMEELGDLQKGVAPAEALCILSEVLLLRDWQLLIYAL